MGAQIKKKAVNETTTTIMDKQNENTAMGVEYISKKFDVLKN